MCDLVKRLDIKAGVMEMGEKIAWGSDTALMREAARKIEAMQAREEQLQKVLEIISRILQDYDKDSEPGL